MHRTRIALAAPLCLVLLVSTATAGAQAPGVVVDGRKNPELIPDLVAWVAMFSQVAEGPVAIRRELRQSYLEMAKLSASQVEIVIDAGTQFMIYERATQRKYKKLKEENLPGPGARERLTVQFQAAHAELMKRAEDMVRALENDLGPEAFQKLLLFVRTKVKSETHM